MEGTQQPPQYDAEDTASDLALLKAIAANPATAQLLARMAAGEDIGAELASPSSSPENAPQEAEKPGAEPAAPEKNDPLYRGPANAPYAGPRSYDGFLAASRPGFWD